MVSPKLTLYIDIVSPFAQISFHVLRTSPIFQNCQITYIPVLLGAVIKACGSIPPLNIKNKDRWVNIERLRWARQFNVPMSEVWPEGFPVVTLAAQRSITAVTILDPPRTEAVIAALFRALWVDGGKVGSATDLLPVLAGVLGEDTAREVVAKSASDEVKKLLAKNTEDLLSEGGFGLPWFAAENVKGEKECFWGFDHLGQVLQHLGLDRPMVGKEGEKWKAMM